MEERIREILPENKAHMSDGRVVDFREKQVQAILTAVAESIPQKKNPMVLNAFNSGYDTAINEVLAQLGKEE